MKKIWLLALLAWIGLATWWYVCKTCNCCVGETMAVPAAATTDAYGFGWNGQEIKLNPGFSDWKRKLLAAGGVADTLVVGQYWAKEPGGEKLGLARAEALKANLKDAWDPNRIVCRAKMVPDLLEANAPFMAASFDWNKAKINQNETTILSQGNDFIILFPFRSAVKDADKKVDDLLKELSVKHAKDAATFTITGHTDNVGDEMPNKALGQARADFIAGRLQRDGIAKERITANSMGEAQPVATNDTDEGRHQNRRVVIAVKQ